MAAVRSNVSLVMEIYNSFVVYLPTIIAIIQSISATNSNPKTLKFKNSNNNNNSQSANESEALPRAQAWSQEPLCPLWGPMESFYQEGIEKERVSVFLFSQYVLIFLLYQYLGRWWLQDKYSELSDFTQAGKCWSQVYSVNYINQTIHRQSDYQSIMSVIFN